MAGHAILFEHANFRGAHKHVFQATRNLNAGGDHYFEDRVSSIAVVSGNWEVFRSAEFAGPFPVVLGPGLYSFVGDARINDDDLSSLCPTDRDATIHGARFEGHAILFDHPRFHGAHKHVFAAEGNLNAADDNFFQDRVSSIAPVFIEAARARCGRASPKRGRADRGPCHSVRGTLYSWVEDCGIRNDDLSSLAPWPNAS
ncbi:MAG: beta/gamma crystallin-related protein [Burkholderiales bacterium]